MKTLIAIQEEYIETVNSGIERWSHRKGGGHMRRISRGAHHKAEAALRKIGYVSQDQIDSVIKQAREMAELERICQE